MCENKVYGGYESIGLPRRRAEREGYPGRHDEGVFHVRRLLGEGERATCALRAW